MPFTLPDLPYAHDALEPYVDKMTMEIHHGKHHAAYVTNLNKATENTEWATKSIEDILKNVSKLAPAVRNNGGGHYNHSLFWKLMKKGGGGQPAGELANATTRDFGTFDKFKEQFANAGVTRFGSGWAWLVCTPEGKLEIISTSNAGTPVTDNKKALLTCDVWEHAYYIDYRNARAKYVESFWKCVNWAFVAKNFSS